MARKTRKTRRVITTRPDTRGRDDILNLVERFGIAAYYRQIPDSAKAGMYAKCLPPLVTLDRTVKDDPDAQVSADGIREGLRQMQLELGWLNNAKIPLQSIYTGLPHLQICLRNFANANPAHIAAARCRAMVDDVVAKALGTAGSMLEMLVISRLMPFQRFDRWLYGMRLPRIPAGTRHIRTNIQIFREPARRVQVEFEGIARPAYQCGGFLRPGVIDWVAWRPADLDMEGPDQGFPVFVQNHALKNLYERLGALDAMNEPAVMMFQSLMKPNVVVRQPDGSMLVECRAELGRLGYFVVHFLRDKFLVNTFLFLTMEGTPESHRLYERLRITRHAVEMMKLDDLATFLLSDIRDDKQLAGVLTECGCGHLLTMTDRLPFKVKALMRQARHLRRILGWAASDSEAEEPTLEEAISMMDEMGELVSHAEQAPGFLGRMARRLIGMMES